jgi:cobalamin biosynthesis protein CbiG
VTVPPRHDDDDPDPDGRVVIGLGLNSRATADDVIGSIDVALATIGLQRTDVVTVATAEHRRGHPALDHLWIEVTYLAAEHFGGDGVAEPAARSVAPNGRLLVPKRCTARVCVAIVSATRHG